MSILWVGGMHESPHDGWEAAASAALLRMHSSSAAANSIDRLLAAVFTPCST